MTIQFSYALGCGSLASITEACLADFKMIPSVFCQTASWLKGDVGPVDKASLPMHDLIAAPYVHSLPPFQIALSSPKSVQPQSFTVTPSLSRHKVKAKLDS